MRTRSRIRRIAKWTGLVVCLLLGGVWVASGWCTVKAGNGANVAVIGAFGHVTLFLAPQPEPRPTFFCFFPTFEIAQVERFTQEWRWPAAKRLPIGRPALTAWRIEIPLWPVFSVAAILTACLWYRDRRRIPPGHCRDCGYNLTGNVSGRCPECGTPFTADQARKPPPGDGCSTDS